MVQNLKALLLVLMLITTIGISHSAIATKTNPSTLISPLFENKENFSQNLQEREEQVIEIPLITQERNLSCEAASIRMILNSLGKEISEEAIQQIFPSHNNPNLGFRGNVNGRIWGFKDYGVYAQPVADVLNQLGTPATAYQQITENQLKQLVLRGRAAIIWVNVANPKPQTKLVSIGEEKIKLISGEHTVVVKGYQDGLWIINDPWRRTSKKGEKISEVIQVKNLDDLMWDDFNHMAVVLD